MSSKATINMSSVTAGKACLSIASLMTCIGPFIADWNDTHIKNPNFSPHAKFHNAQTMSMGLCLGLLSLFYTWRPRSVYSTDTLRTAAILGSLYSITAISAWLYPGALAIDPEFGQGFPQLPIFLVMTVLPWIGYYIDTRI